MKKKRITDKSHKQRLLLIQIKQTIAAFIRCQWPNHNTYTSTLTQTGSDSDSYFANKFIFLQNKMQYQPELRVTCDECARIGPNSYENNKTFSFLYLLCLQKSMRIKPQNVIGVRGRRQLIRPSAATSINLTNTRRRLTRRSNSVAKQIAT